MCPVLLVSNTRSRAGQNLASEDDERGNDEEGSKDTEAQTIDNHCDKLPLTVDHFSASVLFSHFALHLLQHLHTTATFILTENIIKSNISEI